MSGIFARTRYDECNNYEQLNISTGPDRWTQNTIQTHPNACMSANGPRNSRLMNSSELNARYNDVVDIESSLFGLDVPLSRCMNAQTLMERDTSINKLYNNIQNKSVPLQCSNVMDFNYTRLNVQDRVTERPYNNWDYPIIDPREFVYYGFQQFNTDANNRDGSATRYETKIQLEGLNKKLKDSAVLFNNISPNSVPSISQTR